VELRPSGDQKFGLAFLPNPNIVLLDLWARKAQHNSGPLVPAGLAALQDATISAFLERAIDVGANDAVEEHVRLNAIVRGEQGAVATPARARRPRKPKAPS
jgi:hypothetical protein